MAEKKAQSVKPWGGVFTEATDELFEKFSESISFDSRMYAQDIAGSIAHARMLNGVGILTKDEFEAIERELNAIKRKLNAAKWVHEQPRGVHMPRRERACQKLGGVGRKHTARSRNDQVSTDFRLWTREAIDRQRPAPRAPEGVVARCDADFDVIIARLYARATQPSCAAYLALIRRETGTRSRTPHGLPKAR